MSLTARSASSSGVAGLDPFTDPGPVRVLVRDVVVRFLEAVDAGLNILVSGGTQAGNVRCL
jgi:hypothetical protein